MRYRQLLEELYGESRDVKRGCGDVSDSGSNRCNGQLQIVTIYVGKKVAIVQNETIAPGFCAVLLGWEPITND